MIDTYSNLLAIPEPEHPPTVVFLDAVGTLFGVRGGVGSIYRQFALDYGVDCEAGAIERFFYRAFKAADSSVFVGADPAQIPGLEYLWWQNINQQTFAALGQIENFTDFAGFFAELYAFFATAEAWTVYEDTVAALTGWQQKGWQLSVLSNFDTRLYRVLSALQLAGFFETVTISTEVGAAKPAETIFRSAIQKALGDQPHDRSKIWHIGDSELEDYQGATACGLQAWLLQRS
jgi:putative hydrolase of the HAD superfamily